MTPEDLERFWAKVDKTPGHGPYGDCWIWTAACFANHYGAFQLNGRAQRAHRLSFALAHGRPVRDGLLVCHTCDNRRCVNPAHLWEGTTQENTKDRDQKGRGARPHGTRNAMCKLTDTQVAEINKRRHRGELLQVIAADYGISFGYVSELYHRKKRKHVA